MRVNRITATAATVSLAGALALGAAGAAGAVPAAPADPGDHTPGHGAGVEQPGEARADVTAASATARIAQQAGAMQNAVKPINHMTKVLVEVGKLKERKLAPEQAERFRTQMDRAVKPLLSKRTASEGMRTPAAPTQDMTSKAASDLRTRVNTLLNAAVHGTAEQRTVAANHALSGGTNLLAATLASGRLAAPDMKGLPKMSNAPQTPQTDQAPQAPSKQEQAPQTPQAPQQEQAPQAGQAPQTPQQEQAQQAPAAPVTPEQGR